MSSISDRQASFRVDTNFVDRAVQCRNLAGRGLTDPNDALESGHPFKRTPDIDHGVRVAYRRRVIARQPVCLLRTGGIEVAPPIQVHGAPRHHATDVADGDRLVDNHTSIDHAKAHCPSHEIYKGILGGHAKAVFNGKIIVRQDAQKTDAKQTNRALLLSDTAQINTKPQLEIFADDVKCTHGAAIGQLDDDAIFYLRARGLTFFEARDMLIHAFAGDILDRIKIEGLKVALEAELYAQLAKDLAEVDGAA